MPISPTNTTKNAISPTSSNKAGYATWGDDEVAWGDSILTWGAPSSTVSNQSKNSISPTNATKN